MRALHRAGSEQQRKHDGDAADALTSHDRLPDPSVAGAVGE
jgi:hypothetical protein